MKLLGRISIIALCGLSALTIFSASVAGQNPVSVSMSVNPAKAAVGGKLTARVAAAIDGGWKMYSITQGGGGPIPTRITVPDGTFKLAGNVTGTRPTSRMDPNFGIVTETYSGSAIFSIPVSVDNSAPRGIQTLTVNVRYQVCNETVCLPPKTVKVTAPVEVVEVSVAAATPLPSPSPTPTQTATPKDTNTNLSTDADLASDADSNTSEPGAGSVTISNEPPPARPPDSGDQLSAASSTSLDLDSSLVAFLWAAAIAGALSLLTPCVFPMVPITVSYFTNHPEGRRGRATVGALVFAFGIIFTFTVLGLLLTFVFGAAGINKFASSPYVNILIAGLLLTFAFSLFGAFNLGLPPTVLTKLDSFSRGRESNKMLGPLLMGLLFSITSLTCTAPLIGGLLVMATQGNWFYPALGMIAFSTVFSLPFFFLALAPQLMAQLPRSGAWLNSVKVVMGFLEVAAAMKFISNVDLIWGWGFFTREVVLATWVAVSLLIALYLLGVFHFSHDSKEGRSGPVSVMISFAFLSLCIFMLTGLFGNNLGELESFLPPKVQKTTMMNATFEPAGKSGNQEPEWITNDLDQALKLAKEENKPVFVDFTGYTCTNCRWMEANMFTRASIRDELAKYVLVRLYTDGEGEIYEKQQALQQERFGTVALPLYASIDGAGRSISSFAGLTRDEAEFRSFLRIGSSSSAASKVKDIQPDPIGSEPVVFRTDDSLPLGAR